MEEKPSAGLVKARWNGPAALSRDSGARAGRGRGRRGSVDHVRVSTGRTTGVKPASLSTRATSCARAGTEATKVSVPVVAAEPLEPPAICWSIRVIDTGVEVVPTRSDGGHGRRCVEQPRVVRSLGHRQREGDQAPTGAGDVGNARGGLHGLRPRRLGHYRREVRAAETAVAGDGARAAYRLRGGFCGLAGAQDDRADCGPRRCGRDTTEQNRRRREQEVPWRQAH